MLNNDINDYLLILCYNFIYIIYIFIRICQFYLLSNLFDNLNSIEIEIMVLKLIYLKITCENL
jgi:hypothetical protein